MVELGLKPDSSDDKCHLLSSLKCYITISKKVRWKAKRKDAIVCWKAVVLLGMDNSNNSQRFPSLFSTNFIGSSKQTCGVEP